MTEISSECWWTIMHRGHFAWYQRSLLSGDFRPGLIPRSEYVVEEDGRAIDLYSIPRCKTCDEVPDVNDLEPVERITGVQGFLEDFRRDRRDPQWRPWSATTNESTCWWCNYAGKLVETQPPLCQLCVGFLKEQ